MRERRRPTPSGPPLVGALLSWSLAAILLVAFAIAWLVRIDARWAAELIDAVLPGLVDLLRGRP